MHYDLFNCKYFFILRSDAARAIIQEAAEVLQLQHPEVITATNLRKQLASYSQLLNLSTNELESLATFMGKPK